MYLNTLPAKDLVFFEHSDHRDRTLPNSFSCIGLNLGGFRRARFPVKGNEGVTAQTAQQQRIIMLISLQPGSRFVSSAFYFLSYDNRIPTLDPIYDSFIDQIK